MRNFVKLGLSLGVLVLLLQTAKVDADSGRWVKGGSSNNSSTATPKTSTINGTYKGQHKRDYITLTISGTTGTWTEVENDGD